jgi:hypothetical protein
MCLHNFFFLDKHRMKKKNKTINVRILSCKNKQGKHHQIDRKKKLKESVAQNTHTQRGEKEKNES